MYHIIIIVRTVLMEFTENINLSFVVSRLASESNYWLKMFGHLTTEILL